MSSKIQLNQRNITEYFNTISASKQKNQKQASSNTKLSKQIEYDKFNHSDEESSKELFKITNTPKRCSSDVQKTPASKKRKTTSTAVKSTVTKNSSGIKTFRYGRCPIDFGPVGTMRKLDFDDCIQNNANNDSNHDNQSNSFADFLKSRTNEDPDLKKKLTAVPLMKADDIRERLKSCKNLSKLKEQLSNINNCTEKIRQFKEMKIQYQQNFNSSKSSPVKLSPRKPLFGSPIKIVNSSPIKLSPIKPRNLFGLSPKTPTKNADVKDSAEFDLPLPIHFKRMVDLFKMIDYNSWRMYKRQEVCTFDKLKQVVEDSTHRTFTLDMLLKILTINKDYPRFRLSWEFYAGQLKLVITPIYDQQTLKCLNSLGTLLEREKEFHQCLLNITRVKHLKFLSDMQLTLNNCDQIYRWHPMFKLDSVEDIQPDFTLLPNKPEQTPFSKPKKNTILDYFGGSKLEQEIESSPKIDSTLEKSKIKSGLLKGISADILNKVRAKEAAKLAAMMKRPPETDREIRTLSKLIDVSRIIYDCFLGSSIRSIEKQDLIQRISDSMPMSIPESRRHLEYLCSFKLDQVGTKWIKVIQFRNTNFIQIDSTFPLANLFMAFRKRMKQLQDS